MNPMTALMVLNAISSLLSLRDSAELAALKAEIQALIDKLTPTLPTKPDGSAWNEADVRAAAARARSAWESVLTPSS